MGECIYVFLYVDIDVGPSERTVRCEAFALEYKGVEGSDVGERCA